MIFYIQSENSHSNSSNSGNLSNSNIINKNFKIPQKTKIIKTKRFHINNKLFISLKRSITDKNNLTKENEIENSKLKYYNNNIPKITEYSPKQKLNLTNFSNHFKNRINNACSFKVISQIEKNQILIKVNTKEMQKQRRILYTNKIKKIQNWWRNISFQKQKYYQDTVLLSKIIIFTKFLKKKFFAEFKNNIYNKNNFADKTQKSFYSKKTYRKKLTHLKLETSYNFVIDNSQFQMIRPIITEYPSTAKYHKKVIIKKNKKSNSYLKTNSNISSKSKLINYKIPSSLNSNKKIHNSRNSYILVGANNTVKSYLERGTDYSKDLTTSSYNNTHINSNTINPTIVSTTINETHSKNIRSRNNIKTDLTHNKTYSNFEQQKNFPPRLKININSINYNKFPSLYTMKHKIKTNDNNKEKIFFVFQKWKRFMEKMHIINLLKKFLIRNNCKKKIIQTTQRRNPKISCIKDKYILGKLKNITIKMSISAILKGLIKIKNAMFFYKKYAYFNKYKNNINRKIILQRLKKYSTQNNKHKNKKNGDFISNININNFINYNDYSNLHSINKNNMTSKALLAQKTGNFYMGSSNNNKKSNINKIRSNINLIMQINQLKMIFNILEAQRNRDSKKPKLKYYFNLWKKKKKFYRKINSNLVYHKKKLSISTGFANCNESFYNYSTKHNPYLFYLNNVNNRLSTSNNKLSRNKFTFLSRNENLADGNNNYFDIYPISKTQGSIEEKEVVFPSNIVLNH